MYAVAWPFDIITCPKRDHRAVLRAHVLIKNAQYNKPSEDGKRPEPLVQPAEQLQHSGYSASGGTTSEGTKGAHCRYSSALGQHQRASAHCGPQPQPLSQQSRPRLCIDKP